MAIDKEELEEIFDDFRDLTKLSKEKGLVRDANERKIFLDFYNQTKLNQSTNKLYWATIFIASAAIFQLISVLQGKAVAMEVIVAFGAMGIVILVVALVLSFWDKLKNRFGKTQKK